MFQVEHVAPILLHHQAIHHVLVRKKPPKHDGCVPIGISSKICFFDSERVLRGTKTKMSKEMLFVRSLEHHLPRFLLLPLTLIHFPWSFKLARVIHLKSKMEVQWLEVLGSWGWLKSQFTTGSMPLIKGYINISVKSLSTAYWPTSSNMLEHCEHCREKSTPFVQPCPLEIRIYYKKMMRGGVSI